MNLSDFKIEIDNKFWNTITNKMRYKDIVNFNDITRNELIDELINELQLSEYSLSTPVYYYFPKKNGILRRIKIYGIKDICVYYYCVKKIQHRLVEKIEKIETSFGGFRFSADNKSYKQDYISDYDNLEEYKSVLETENYRNEWRDYQNLALEAYERGFKQYIHIDIAHFYDDINLDILEGKVRSIINEDKEIIDILFYFLRMSDKKDLGYSIGTVGIPQEEIGEMSRVLANFYLSYYDESIVNYLNDLLGEDNYLYFRYSDDMWFCINDNISKNIIQKASLLLNSIKLHINTDKIKILDEKSYHSYWKFEEWEEVKNNKKDSNYLTNIHHIFSKENQTGRWISIVKYYIKVLISNLDNIEILHNNNQVSEFINYLLYNAEIIDSLDDSHKEFFIQLINRYNQYLDVFTKYIESEDNIYPSVEYFILEILINIKDIKKIQSFILNLLENKYKYNEEGDWYARCICIRFFIIHKIKFNIRKKYIQNILNIINLYKDNIKINMERRYIVYFLFVYELKKEIIYTVSFNTTDDKLFKLYLEGEIK